MVGHPPTEPVVVAGSPTTAEWREAWQPLQLIYFAPSVGGAPICFVNPGGVGL